MALTSVITTTIDVRPDGVLQVRSDRVVTDDTDGSQMVGNRRAVYTPNMDPAMLPAGRLRRVAIAVWDAATVAAYIAAQGS